MDRHRGDRYGSNPDSHHYRHSRGPPRSPDGPMNNHHRRSPNNYRGGFSSGGAGGGGGGGHHRRAFDSPPRYPPSGGGGGGGGVGYRPIGGGGFGSNQQMPLSGQKRGYPFSGRGSSPDRFDGGNFAKLFVGSVPRTATEEDIRPPFEEHGQVLEVALIKDKRTGQQQATFLLCPPCQPRGRQEYPLKFCLHIAVANLEEIDLTSPLLAAAVGAFPS